ncbi:MAG TPA: serine/threonine-protein kinase, partial [Candidatus Thermoplasmatota archaeon]|nr:serine/threonine-protein kinase [Candidatus Thermoplasmatota archaeon]
LPPREAGARACEVLDALDALHARGLAHGDVKPANVLLADDGTAKLADFGLARAWGDEATRTRVSFEGTLSALAPEQVDGAAPSPASDVYAAGALLYRLLTGAHYVPLHGVGEAEARARVRAHPPLLPHPGVPAPLERVVARALAKSPGARYPSAGAMRRDLEDALSRL